MLLIFLLISPVQLLAADLLGLSRGDCNGDGLRNLADPISHLEFLFGTNATIPCEDANDVNDDGVLDVSDAVFLLEWLFLSGPVPPGGMEGCSLDETPDTLGCQVPSCTIASDCPERCAVLPVGHVGRTYTSHLSLVLQTGVETTINPIEVIQTEIRFEHFVSPIGSELPAGLQLDADGRISGVPEAAGRHTFTVWGRSEAGEWQSHSVDLGIFSSDESEVIGGQDLSQPGPFSVGELSGNYLHVHQLPNPSPYPLWPLNGCGAVPASTSSIGQMKPYRILYPLGLDEATSILLFHHGTGYSYLDYDYLGEHLASRGFIIVLVNDTYSYLTYPIHYCWGGHDEGARVLLSLREEIVEVTSNTNHPLHDAIDWDRVFYGGHSRGGASAIIAAEFDPKTRGIIALQPTEAKGDSWIGYTTRWDQLPDVPILDITAEQDFDVIWPFADRLLERFTGATTMVGLHGGCHGYSTSVSDAGCNICDWIPSAPWLDQCRYISRDLQWQLTCHYATAFLERHGRGNLSTDGILYGEEAQLSPFVSLVSRRRDSGEILIDDFSTFPTNQLGYPIEWSGQGTVGVGSCYDVPSPAPAPLLPIDNLILQLDFNGQLAITEQLGSVAAPLDASEHRQFKMRLKNHDRWGMVDNFGFSWLQLEMVLRDSRGREAAIALGAKLPEVETHPQPFPASTSVTLKYQRYRDVSVTLGEFTSANPDLDLSSLVELRLDWVTSSNPQMVVSPRIGIDDLRLE
ncbi:MAG TPA: hypothetical protein EYN79_02730 [Planctomycetes bacterium]|nr:hypothetical protein [Planctomycetota bacterium]HIN80218.1 hypothetical protein [Planctomycetota bacterium]